MQVFDEMAALAPKFSGISHRRTEETGDLQWPCPTTDHPGTPTLHEGGPVIGKANSEPVQYRKSDELPDSEYPLILSTGRTLYHYNSATETRRERGPVMKQRGSFIEVHRRDAR